MEVYQRNIEEIAKSDKACNLICCITIQNSSHPIGLTRHHTYRPSTAGSPGVDAGADLSFLFDFDREGSGRPQGSAWDIGAYEYQSTSLNRVKYKGNPIRSRAQTALSGPVTFEQVRTYLAAHPDWIFCDVTGKQREMTGGGLGMYWLVNARKHMVNKVLVVR